MNLCLRVSLISALGLACFMISGCSSDEPLPTVDTLDLHKYAGTWYEIARLPNSFEKGLQCVTANYTVKDNGKVRVLNSGRKEPSLEKVKNAKGKAYVPDPSYPARLKVTFFWPFAGDYYVIALDEDYTHALVGSPSREYLWILSRTKTLGQKKTDRLLEIASAQGFDVEQMVWIDQSCD